MLAIVRRHVDVGLKIILGIIIVTFVLFFGYTSLRQKAPDTTAIRVGKTDISYSTFRFFQRNQYERIRETFKDGEIPDFLQKSLQESLTQQLIHQTLVTQFALKLGIQVTDQELADFIRKNKDFDPVAYKDFLVGFYAENGFPYETYIREQLLLQKFQKWVEQIEEEVKPKATKKWTFETITLEGEDKKGLAKEIQSFWSQKKEVGPLLKKKNLKVEKGGPISLSERHKLFNGALSLEDYVSIFQLKKPMETLTNPIVHDKRLFLVRLVAVDPPKNELEEVPNNYPQFRLVDFWFQNFIKKTPIQSFIAQETP